RHTRWPRDWSSDVCSSDLTRPLGSFIHCCGGEKWYCGRYSSPYCGAALSVCATASPVGTSASTAAHAFFIPLPFSVGGSCRAAQIGRASCRERVGRSVAVG